MSWEPLSEYNERRNLIQISCSVPFPIWKWFQSVAVTLNCQLAKAGRIYQGSNHPLCTMSYTFIQHLFESDYGNEKDLCSNLASCFLLVELNHTILIKHWRKSEGSKCKICVFVPILNPLKTTDIRKLTWSGQMSKALCLWHVIALLLVEK